MACGVDGRAEVQAAGRHAADHARARRSASAGRSICSSVATSATPSGMPMPRLTTALRVQLERGAARDDLALVQRAAARRLLIGTRISPAKAGAVRRREGLQVVLGLLGHDDAVDQHARHLAPGAGSACRARRCARPARSRCRRCCARPCAIASVSSVSASRSIVRLPSGSAVVARISADRGSGRPCRTATPRRRSRSARTRSSVVAALILPPPWRGSTKVPQADAAERARLAGGDVAEQVRDHALRQVVGLDLARDGQRLQLRARGPSGRR